MKQKILLQTTRYPLQGTGKKQYLAALKRFGFLPRGINRCELNISDIFIIRRYFKRDFAEGLCSIQRVFLDFRKLKKAIQNLEGARKKIRRLVLMADSKRKYVSRSAFNAYYEVFNNYSDLYKYLSRIDLDGLGNWVRIPGIENVPSNHQGLIFRLQKIFIEWAHLYTEHRGKKNAQRYVSQSQKRAILKLSDRILTDIRKGIKNPAEENLHAISLTSPLTIEEIIKYTENDKFKRTDADRIAYIKILGYKGTGSAVKKYRADFRKRRTKK